MFTLAAALLTAPLPSLGPHDVQTAGAPAAGQTPVPPDQDPVRLQVEARLKERQRRENDTQDLREKERLLLGIIDDCIELGREYAPYQQRLAEVRQRLEKETLNASTQANKERQNVALRERAVQALTANPPQLTDAARDLDAALRLFPRDPETNALRERVTRELRNQLFRRIALVVLLSAATLALALPLLKTVAKGVQTRELEMIEGPQPGELFRLAKETTRIGSSAADADIVIADPFRNISRRHCEILRNGKHYFLTDCSSNGTSINDRPAPKGEPVLLKRGDRITLAENVVLRLR